MLLDASVKNIVLLTGATNYLSDGNQVISVENGHSLLGEVTGTGCAVGSIAASFLAAYRSEKLLAVLSGIVMYEIAAENAAAKEYVRGPGSFVQAFIDELYDIRMAAATGNDSWLIGRAKIRSIVI
ncbi:hypothetical protein N7495_003583 [Penicillium taxi]|uniref:uncharacterized protein n=1 Tax=Penicillium taxi TaxID=168475 RepID=UPI002545AABB|nr:uncharacterized protein N7495_003583 [Penicillium taxi]KAJ5898839.1 hypothetical protein N7495_003583 [Penicillium taxi]